MKRIMIKYSLWLAVLVGISGCYKDVISPETDPDGPPQAVSFKDEIAPVLNTKCALSGCHVTGSHKPFLKTNESYSQIVNGGFVNILVPKESVLYKNINGGMREYIPSATDRQKIFDWIRNGAPNN